MARLRNLVIAMLYTLTVAMLGDVGSITAKGAVLPRSPPSKMSGTDSAAIAVPTPLSVVSAYTLYFGNAGATVAAPVMSQASSTTTLGPASTSITPARSTSKAGQCTKKHSSARSSTSSLVSTSAASKSTPPSAPQQITIFPTVAAASSTPTAGRANVNAAVLPHNFINKVDSLVDTFHGITGRKARQVAMILSNQTSIVANTSETDTILTHLAETYPATNATSSNKTLSSGAVYGDQAAGAAEPAAVASSDNENTGKLPQSYIMQAGRSSITLLSNTPGYGPDQVRHDLHIIRKWAGDLGQLSTPALLDETVAAIMSASARYYPELSTRDAARVIMADIKAESDFDPTNVSGGRLDSGSSWGLMQVSPFGSGELQLFQQHAAVKRNTYSWNTQYNATTTPAHFGAGPLLDWSTGLVLSVKSLTNQDLLRPWVNIHVASWIQSNLARTSSQDPYTWGAVYQKSNTARRLNDWTAVSGALQGAGLPRSCMTGLGSWVAGPAVDGLGSYTRKGDDISAPYFKNIAQGLSVLYNTTIKPAWLNSLSLHAGLIDYN